MTVQENISDFNSCVAVVLSALYDHFPVPLRLNATSLEEASDPDRSLKVIDDHPRGGDFDPVITEKLSRYRWSIQFLIHEGFVHDVREEQTERALRHGLNVAPKAPASPVFPALVLTAKGLVLLNALPQSLVEKPKTHIERLKAALKEHSDHGLKEAIGALIAQGVSGVFG